MEHLLRDVNDPSVSSLGFEVRHKLQALKGLAERLKDMSTYLEDVLTDRMPANNQVSMVGEWSMGADRSSDGERWRGWDSWRESCARVLRHRR